MISFVWSSAYPFMAGTGGSENYTFGQVRELAARGIKTRIITLGFGENDGRAEFPDIQFTAIENEAQLAELDDTLIFITEPLGVKTKRKSYVILHCPPAPDPKFYARVMADKQPIVTSHHAAKIWSEVLGIPAGDIPIVYPFAQSEFGEAVDSKAKKTRVLFAGRLTPDKGIYTLMWVMHSHLINGDFSFTATNAGAHTPAGRVIHKLLKAHPDIRIIKARKTPASMAKLLANTDIVVMPSSMSWWDEMFGILSVEAQHAGARVVASNGGGLPETDCGGLILINPDDPRALEQGILEAAKLGRLTKTQRTAAATKFTLKDSVDKLLQVLNY